MKQLTIGRLAKKCGVNVETVRYYERRKLLPVPPRSPSGYRHYSEDDVDRICFIKGAQVLGFTLKEIGELLSLCIDSMTSSSEMKRRTEQKIADIEAKLRSLEEMKKALITLKATCKGGDTSNPCPILEALGKFGKTGQCCQESE